LIINDQEWSTRSLESILGPNGYAILRAYTAAKGFERALAARPDLILIGASLPDMSGPELCQRLRMDPHITPSTPVILTTTTKPSRRDRLDALRSGAWDYLGHPLDGEELVLRFDAYVRAKHDADQARTDGMVDAVTGLYSLQGLARRARELASQAYRQGAPLACVVFRAEGDDAGLDAVVRDLAERFQRLGRTSDAIGRIGEAEFAVFAPGTDGNGAAVLASRLVSDVGKAQLPHPFRVLTAYHAVEDFRAASLHPQDMLARASAALQQARDDEVGTAATPTGWSAEPPIH
jgi:diguanylate cyclase (GGDEF)-like protein